MIVLDTHIWVWWVHGDERLTQTQIETITANEADLIGVSAISCWEVAKLVEYGRLELPCHNRRLIIIAAGLLAHQISASPTPSC